MIRPKSLRQRMAIFVLLPVALLLVGMGLVGFMYARNSLIAQWQEAAILKLQRAAHNVDMRLSRIKTWIQMLDQAGENQHPNLIYSWVIDQLNNAEGVSRVTLNWNDKNAEPLGDSEAFDDVEHRHDRAGQMVGLTDKDRERHQMMMRRFHRTSIRDLTAPRYDSLVEHQTVSLISDLIDKAGQTIGRFEVIIRFDYLTKNIIDSGWWQSNKAFLVDDNGKILSSTVSEDRKILAGNDDPVELATLNALKTRTYGTIRGPGHPPDEVSGFYKLQEAPWSLVMIAPGEKILSPILRFRLYFIISGTVFILLILLLIKVVTGWTVSSIKDISRAAERIARGDFGQPLAVKTQDEVGELTRSFNTMVLQLEERIRLKQALDVAVEVQQNLLPQTMPRLAGLDIYGQSIYCDETGGDFYDFIKMRRANMDHIGIAVGDVSGHGISAALLMATIRAFLKSRVAQSASIAESISSVNRLMAQDMRDSGQFVTLFYTEVSPNEKALRWVRAGHDPALFYDPQTDDFCELQGKGVALGVNADVHYQEYTKAGFSKGQILLIGTDGLWETQNHLGEMFGKERIKELIQHNKHLTSEALIKSIIDALRDFQGSVKQNDDITLVVVKVAD